MPSQSPKLNDSTPIPYHTHYQHAQPHQPPHDREMRYPSGSTALAGARMMRMTRALCGRTLSRRTRIPYRASHAREENTKDKEDSLWSFFSRTRKPQDPHHATTPPPNHTSAQTHKDTPRWLFQLCLPQRGSQDSGAALPFNTPEKIQRTTGKPFAPEKPTGGKTAKTFLPQKIHRDSGSTSSLRQS